MQLLDFRLFGILNRRLLEHCLSPLGHSLSEYQLFLTAEPTIRRKPSNRPCPPKRSQSLTSQNSLNCNTSKPKMLEYFTPRHIPALIAATTMTFGGMWPILNARAAMLEFGLPARVADAPATWPVMVIGQVRTTCLGTLMLWFYARGQFDVLDTFMAVTGAYAGVVDSWVLWRERENRNAAFRLLSSGLIAGCGIAGLTASGR